MQFRRKNRVRGLPIERLEGRVLLSTATFHIGPTPGPVTGVVYFDTNGNRLLDAGETPAAGVVVYSDENRNRVLDTGETNVTTDEVGQYSLFNGGLPIIVAVEPPGAWFYGDDLDTSG